MASRTGRPAPRAGAVMVLLAAGGVAGAQVDPDGLNIRRSGPGQEATFITARGGGPIPVNMPRARQRHAGLAFFDQYGHLFGVTDPVDQLSARTVVADALGQVHTTYQQMHRGVPVFSGVLKLHQDVAGNVLAANGRFYPIKPTLEVAPTIDEAGAAAAGMKALAQPCKPIVEDAELTIVDPGWYGDPATGERLAWRIVLTDLEAGVRQAMFIDAHTGEVLDQWTLIEQLLAREVYDAGGGPSLPGTLARPEGSGAVADADVNRAYDYAGDFHAYLQRAFGRDSLDDNGFTLRLTVNSTSTSCPNAYWNGFQTVYCTGVVTDDIVAHELAHGLTEMTAGLIYQNQCGQLNEHFSDVFGELVDLFNGDASEPGAPGGIPWPDPPAAGPGTDTPNDLRTACSPRPFHPDGVRWCIGEDSVGFAGAIREMYDPTCRDHPDRANSPLMTCPAVDGGGVHHGSGVPNKAFALAVDGGTFNGRTVTGIGAIKAGAIWYRALTTYLTPVSDFKDAYDAIIQSANDLLGTSPNDPRTGMPSASAITAADVEQVTEALLATEMDTDGACGETYNVLDPTVPIECAGATVIFSDDFESVNPGWTVANSSPPTPYDWELTTDPLPWGRPGAAFFCEARVVGDCVSVDESAVHTLTSPVIEIPPTAAHPTLAFTHHIASEGRFDGGRVEYRVNGGSWTGIPRTAFKFNPYNNRFQTAAAGSTNPLAGEDAFSGVGGRWGRSIVDLSGLGLAGQDVEFRWVYAKDGCGVGLASRGWFIDDVAVYDCPDCDNNAIADIDQFEHRVSTPVQGNIGWESAQLVVLNDLPPAAGDVRIEALSIGDFSGSDEWVQVRVNGTIVGSLFELAGTDCSGTPNRQTLIVPEATWNALVPSGSADITLETTPFTSPVLCTGGSWIALQVRYPLGAVDVNADLVLDACECTTILDQPEALVITDGDNAQFTVAATNGQMHQWRKDGVDLVDGPSAGGGVIGGSTTATLTIMGAGMLDAGEYDVVVSGLCDPVTSTGAALTVNPACPALTDQPDPLELDPGQTAVFTAAAAGTPPLSYQWRRDGVDLMDGPAPGGGTISGAATDTLTITMVGFDDAGDYDVVVTNDCGSTPSSAAALDVGNPCPADFNTSGDITVQDIFDFLAAYFQNEPGADFNESGMITVQDIFDFLAAYFEGCD